MARPRTTALSSCVGREAADTFYYYLRCYTEEVERKARGERADVAMAKSALVEAVVELIGIEYSR